ncbi:MAG TPA: hypothetical protein PKD86_05270 [Gemmatales bacterium]|nr:hypothetical protein [Gemmatales bacterium]HMP58743.1 hypothetical protein [Gemmatales bacterium]
MQRSWHIRNRLWVGILLLALGWTSVDARQDDEAPGEGPESLWAGVLGSGQKLLVKDGTDCKVMGTVEIKVLEQVQKGVDATLPKLKKTLQMSPNDRLWTGSVLVHVCKERAEFRQLYNRLLRRQPLNEETGVYAHVGRLTHLLVGPLAGGPARVPADVEAVHQLGSATLTRLRGANQAMEGWFTYGFGRATAYRYAPRSFSQERQRAAALLAQGKKLGDLQSDQVSGADARILASSVADFLAYSPVMARQWPDFYVSFGGGINIWDALKACDIKPEAFEQTWAVWAQRPR